MGFGSTAKKLQKVASLAEESYKRMNELREQLQHLRNEVENTSQQVDQMEYDLAEQRALLEALAEKEGLDVDSIIADANIEDVDAPAGEDQPTDQTVPVEEAEPDQSAGDGNAASGQSTGGQQTQGNHTAEK